MSVLPQLESELLNAHGRLAARRSRFARAWLARRVRATPTGPGGPIARGRTWLVTSVRVAPVLLAVVVTLVVAVGAFIVIGRHTPGTTPNGPPGGGTSLGPLSAAQQREQGYINAAWQRTESQHPGCAPRQPEPTLSNRTPSAALLSSLGVLRRPATPADVPDSVSHFIPSLPGRSRSLPGQVYTRYVRLARTELLPAANPADAMYVQYFILPAGNVVGASPTPARCYAEQAAALRRELPQIPDTLRGSTLQLEARAVAKQRYDERHPEGIRVQVFDGNGAIIESYGATTAALRQRGATGQGFPWGNTVVASGVVPDGVATVTLHYPAVARDGKTVPPFSVTAHPVSNVFVVRLPRASAVAGPDKTIWRAANGSIIKTILPSP